MVRWVDGLPLPGRLMVFAQASSMLEVQIVMGVAQASGAVVDLDREKPSLEVGKGADRYFIDFPRDLLHEISLLMSESVEPGWRTASLGDVWVLELDDGSTGAWVCGGGAFLGEQTVPGGRSLPLDSETIVAGYKLYERTEGVRS